MNCSTCEHSWQTSFSEICQSCEDFSNYKEQCKMNATEYLILSSRTDEAKDFNTQMLHGILGVTSEAGELADHLKRHTFYGTPFDVGNVKEECGDLMWYIALICRACGFTIEDVMGANIAKLKKRYPNGFTKDLAVVRDLAAEKGVFG